MLSKSNIDARSKPFHNPDCSIRHSSRADWLRQHIAKGNPESGASELLDEKFFHGEFVMEDLSDQIEVVNRHAGKIIAERVEQWNKLNK